MADKQEEVAAELTNFVAELRNAGGVPQDIRIGLITTTVYENVYDPAAGFDPPLYLDCENKAPAYCSQSGKLQPVPANLPDGGVDQSTAGQRVLDNTDPMLVAKFARLVRVGVFGSGQETPFEALRLAVTPPLSTTSLDAGGNFGFMRDDARLLIVVLSDEDDCSEMDRPVKVTIGLDHGIDYCNNQGNFLTPVSTYHDIFTSQIKDTLGNKKDIVYTVIAPVGITTKDAMALVAPGVLLDGGPELLRDGGIEEELHNIDCPNSHGPGIRHRQMAELFDSTLQNLDSVCKPDYHQTLLNIADLAGVSQTLELQGGVPDPNLIKVVITRNATGDAPPCTVANGGITVDPPTSSNPNTRIHFGNTCLRRRDDTGLSVSLLCIY
jgi:hypothetical protein